MQKKYSSPYSKALAECDTTIIKDFPNHLPFIYFKKEERKWNEIWPEWEKIIDKFGDQIPEWSNTEKGDWLIHTRKGVKAVRKK